MLGLVKHLASVEYGWFCETFDRPADPVPFDPDDPDADWRVEPDETVEAIVDYYGRARAPPTRSSPNWTSTTSAEHGSGTQSRCGGY